MEKQSFTKILQIKTEKVTSVKMKYMNVNVCIFKFFILDCYVGDWGYWSECSKTCGFGVQKRYRKVIQIPVQGRPCPSLEQEKWCGGMRNCREQMGLFSWLDKDKKNTQKG